MMDAKICDVCAQPLDPRETHDLALSAGGLMCETPMSVHEACGVVAQDVLGASGGDGCLQGYRPVTEDQLVD